MFVISLFRNYVWSWKNAYGEILLAANRIIIWWFKTPDPYAFLAIMSKYFHDSLFGQRNFSILSLTKIVFYFKSRFMTSIPLHPLNLIWNAVDFVRSFFCIFYKTSAEIQPIPSVKSIPLSLLSSGTVSVWTPLTSTLVATLDRFWPIRAAWRAGFFSNLVKSPKKLSSYSRLITGT